MTKASLEQHKTDASGVELQPASIDIWDKKYRLKAKSGQVIDHTTRSTTTETALQDLTTKLNAFPALIQQEIVNNITGLNDKVAAIEQAINAGTSLTSSGDRGKKIITEYKIIGAQKQLSNDKKEYRQWQEKMKNAMEQVSPDVREVMERIETTVWGKAEEREWLEKEDSVRIIAKVSEARWKEIKRDLYGVLMDKTEGEANMLVKNERRDGLMSYMKINKWYTEQSGKGLTDRKRAVMRPEKVKKESDRKNRL